MCCIYNNNSNNNNNNNNNNNKCHRLNQINCFVVLQQQGMWYRSKLFGGRWKSYQRPIQPQVAIVCKSDCGLIAAYADTNPAAASLRYAVCVMQSN